MGGVEVGRGMRGRPTKTRECIRRFKGGILPVAIARVVFFYVRALGNGEGGAPCAPGAATDKLVCNPKAGDGDGYSILPVTEHYTNPHFCWVERLPVTQDNGAEPDLIAIMDFAWTVCGETLVLVVDISSV